MTWLVDGQTFAKKVKNPTGQLSNNGAESRCRVIHCPSCGNIIPNNHTGQKWPGLPAGVKFDPSDQELLEHLAAKRRLASAKPHPFIDEFIPTLDGEDGICYTHPEKLPGTRCDGNSAHFFHRPSRAYTTGTRKRRRVQSESEDGQFGVEMRWHKTGKTKPVLENGKHLGFKKIMVLYISLGKKTKPEKTNWVMHQYHLGLEEEEQEGELVVSKVFYQSQPRNSSGTLRVSELEEIETAEGAAVNLPECSYDAVMISSLQGTPIHASTMLLEAISDDATRGAASISAAWTSDKMDEIKFSQGATSEGTNQDACSFLGWVNACVKKNEQPNAKIGQDHQNFHLQGESQIVLEQLDSDVMNLLCDESLPAEFTFNHGSYQSFCSIIADLGLTLNEAPEETERSKADSVFDNIVLDTPPDFLLDSLVNSQDTLDWLGKRKFCSSSQISAGAEELNSMEPAYDIQ